MFPLQFFVFGEDVDVDGPSGCSKRQICGGSQVAIERTLAFGRELQTLSVLLRGQHGKNETNKKMLRVTQPFPLLLVYFISVIIYLLKCLIAMYWNMLLNLKFSYYYPMPCMIIIESFWGLFSHRSDFIQIVSHLLVIDSYWVNLF